MGWYRALLGLSVVGVVTNFLALISITAKAEMMGWPRYLFLSLVAIVCIIINLIIATKTWEKLKKP